MDADQTKTRYSDEELKEFEEVIQQKLHVAQAQLDSYLQQIKDNTSTNDKANGVEESIQSTENERLVQMAGRQKKLILHLQNAQLRIQNKVYGICRETGSLISKARLLACTTCHTQYQGQTS